MSEKSMEWNSLVPPPAVPDARVDRTFNGESEHRIAMLDSLSIETADGALLLMKNGTLEVQQV
ncbi:MAG: hypothetical protein K2Z81_21050 [Cyanobacteria bacterium]|nr:hypothetical protein [Cyanobacteriota bacterium]